MKRMETNVRSFHFWLVIIGIACVFGVSALLLSGWPRMYQPVLARPAVAESVLRDPLWEELKALSVRLENYYNEKHVADTYYQRWRARDVHYNMRPNSPDKDPRIAIIDYALKPELPGASAAPTGQRLVLIVENNHWSLMKVRMHLSASDSFGGAVWRDIPYTDGDLASIADERLGIRRASP